MSVGLPMVAFDCKCGPKDLITDGENGFLVSEGNIEALAGKMEILMTEPALRQQMGQAAKIRSERYSESVIMDKWMKLFDDLLNERK